MAGSELDSGEADTPPGTARSITIKMPRTNRVPNLRFTVHPPIFRAVTLKLGTAASKGVLYRRLETVSRRPPPASRRGTKHPTPFGGSKVEAFVTVAYCSQIPPRLRNHYKRHLLYRRLETVSRRPPPASRRGTKHPTPFGGSKVEAFVTVAYCSQIPPRFQIGTVKARGGGGPKGCPFERSPYTPRTSAGNGVGRLDYQEATEK